jgi:biotin carboxyl carrier protein
MRKITILLLVLLIAGCGKKSEVTPGEVKVQVPVTVAHPVIGAISENMLLSATTSFQRKNIIASSVQGYILHADITLGDRVTKGDPLFEMQTKESHVITSSSLADSFKVFGKVVIHATASGIVTAISHQTGDYVQDGDQLCTIADVGSFAFVLSVPFDYTKYIHLGGPCELLLPDSAKISAHIQKKLATIDAVSQAQNFLVVPSTSTVLPENIIAQVTLPTKVNPRAILLPRQAVLADELLQNFWVMQLKSEHLAVKVPVQKGLEREEKVEILTPHFTAQDSFVLSGNYGMDDTAFVTIKQ